MGCSTPGFLVLHHFQELLKFMPIGSMMPSNHLILCLPLLLLSSIFPSIRVFSNESALCIMWPKYWSFSFSFMPSSLAKKKKKNRSSLRKAGKSWLPHSWSTNRLEENQQGKLWRCSKSYLAMNTLFVVDLQKSRSLDSRGQGDQTGQS